MGSYPLFAMTIYYFFFFVELTLNILQQAKRFHATTSFHCDIGFKKVMDKGILIYSVTSIYPIYPIYRYDILINRISLIFSNC